MQTDKYTKVILTLIAIGLFLNLAMYLRVTPAGAASDVLEVVRTKKLEVVNNSTRRRAFDREHAAKDTSNLIIPGVKTR